MDGIKKTFIAVYLNISDMTKQSWLMPILTAFCSHLFSLMKLSSLLLYIVPVTRQLPQCSEQEPVICPIHKSTYFNYILQFTSSRADVAKWATSAPTSAVSEVTVMIHDWGPSRAQTQRWPHQEGELWLPRVTSMTVQRDRRAPRYRADHRIS